MILLRCVRGLWTYLIHKFQPPPPEQSAPSRRPLTGTELGNPNAGEREIAIDTDLPPRRDSTPRWLA
jgi:hypothetical protein